MFRTYYLYFHYFQYYFFIYLEVVFKYHTHTQFNFTGMNGNKNVSTAADRWGSPQGPRPMPILPRTQATATSDFKPFGSPCTSTAMPVHNHPPSGNSSIKNTARSAVLTVNEESTDLKSYRPPNKSAPQLPSLTFVPNSNESNPEKSAQQSTSKVEVFSKSTQGPKSNNLNDPSNGPMLVTPKDGASLNKNFNYTPATAPSPAVIKDPTNDHPSSSLTASINQSTSKSQYTPLF